MLIIIDLAPGRVLPIIPPATIGLGVSASQSPSAATAPPTQRLLALPFRLAFSCGPLVSGLKISRVHSEVAERMLVKLELQRRLQL
eukprot:COSAG01_NODE_35124_length_536_cov_3.487414_1_plen_86_part_00